MKKPIVLLLGVILGLVNLSGQDTEIWKDKRANLDLLNFLDAKMITGYNVESDLTFQLWKGSFPQLEVNSPATMNKFLGGEQGGDFRLWWTNSPEIHRQQPGWRHSHVLYPRYVPEATEAWTLPYPGHHGRRLPHPTQAETPR